MSAPVKDADEALVFLRGPPADQAGHGIRAGFDVAVQHIVAVERVARRADAFQVGQRTDHFGHDIHRRGVFFVGGGVDIHLEPFRVRPPVQKGLQRALLECERTIGQGVTFLDLRAARDDAFDVSFDGDLHGAAFAFEGEVERLRDRLVLIGADDGEGELLFHCVVERARAHHSERGARFDALVDGNGIALDGNASLLLFQSEPRVTVRREREQRAASDLVVFAFVRNFENGCNDFFSVERNHAVRIGNIAPIL